MTIVPELTAHAISRFIARGGAASWARAECDLTALLAGAKEATALPKDAPQGGGTRYFLAGEWVLVVKDGALVTVYRREKQWRWAG